MRDDSPTTRVTPASAGFVVFDYDSKEYPTVTLISRATATFREVAPDHLADLLAPEAIEAFFRLHYWQQGGDDGSGWDRGAEGQSILDCFHCRPKILPPRPVPHRRGGLSAHRRRPDARARSLRRQGSRPDRRADVDARPARTRNGSAAFDRSSPGAMWWECSIAACGRCSTTASCWTPREVLPGEPHRPTIAKVGLKFDTIGMTRKCS